MKHKKLIFMILLCGIVYAIYALYHDNKINYLAIGDSLSIGINAYGDKNYGYSDYVASYLKEQNKLKSYSNDFAVAGYRISDVQHQLETNQIITIQKKALSFKKCLRDAQLVTLSIGGNDLLSELSLSAVDIDALNEKEVMEAIDHVLLNLDDLLKNVRRYAKRDILLIGYYNPLHSTSLPVNRLFSYLNTKANQICKKYDVTYINTYSIFKKNKEFLPNPTNIHPNVEGYEAIAKAIIKELEKRDI